MEEQLKLVAAVHRLDAAYRSGTVRETIAAERRKAIDELGGQHREEVDESEDR